METIEVIQMGRFNIKNGKRVWGKIFFVGAVERGSANLVPWKYSIHHAVLYKIEWEDVPMVGIAEECVR